MNHTMLAEVLAGLRQTPKRLSPKYFYDARGSDLFEQITELPEYYPTRCELEILDQHGADIASSLGPEVVLIELGSGSSTKVQRLLPHLERVRAYVPLDISPSALEGARAQLAERFPELAVEPVAVDYTHPFELPALDPDARWVVFYPGSTIGNLDAHEAASFLARMAATLRPGDGVLMGYDLVKPVAVLERAYDDSAGVTAVFNKNVLRHLNRAVGATFDEGQFKHVAIYDPEAGRIEMHLESLEEQVVQVGPAEVHFAADERLHTESSHKYTREQFAEMMATAGFSSKRLWTDDRGWFAVGLYVR